MKFIIKIITLMSNCDSPICLTPTDIKKGNVKLKVPDELFNYTPLE